MTPLEYIIKRQESVRLRLFAGDDINEVKKNAAEISKALKCKITFNHNGHEFLSDDEGNCAKVS